MAFTIRDYMQGGSVLHSLAGGFAAGDPGEVDASSMSTGPGAINARDFSQKSRKKLAKSGAAMPGGGFPIVNRQDLKNAEQAIGRAKNPGAARAHIRERAKALHVKVSKSFKAGGPGSGRHPEGEHNSASYGGPIKVIPKNSWTCPHCRADLDMTGSRDLGRGVRACKDCGGRFVRSSK